MEFQLFLSKTMCPICFHFLSRYLIFRIVFSVFFCSRYTQHPSVGLHAELRFSICQIEMVTTMTICWLLYPNLDIHLQVWKTDACKSIRSYCEHSFDPVFRQRVWVCALVVHWCQLPDPPPRQSENFSGILIHIFF